jgi:hypothetical protein
MTVLKRSLFGRPQRDSDALPECTDGVTEGFGTMEGWRWPALAG